MSRLQQIVHLRNSAPAILPSLLRCDFGNLEREIDRLTQTSIAGLHLDVMDGRFVPNLSYGMPVVAAVRRLTDLPLDVHLMIEEPQRYISQFCEAGADLITIHIEAVDDARPVLQMIRELDRAAGIALNPTTPLSRVEDCLELCDLVLVMSVEAGFGGQEFQCHVLDKLTAIRQIGGEEVLLEIDGGINPETIGESAAAGAQLFVVGSAIFGQANYVESVEQLSACAST